MDEDIVLFDGKFAGLRVKDLSTEDLKDVVVREFRAVSNHFMEFKIKNEIARRRRRAVHAWLFGPKRRRRKSPWRLTDEIRLDFSGGSR
jgi:hypothetical protein